MRQRLACYAWCQAVVPRRLLLSRRRLPNMSRTDVTAIALTGNSGTDTAGSGPQLLQPCTLQFSLACT